jgi:hypothetical protein
MRFWQLRSAIEIKVQKNSPPYQAFKQIRNVNTEPEAKLQNVKTVVTLSTEQSFAQNITAPQKIVLLEPVVVKKVQLVSSQVEEVEKPDLAWVNELPLRQRVRVQEAQTKFGILDNVKTPRAEPEPESHPVSVVRIGNGFVIKGAIEITGGLGLTNDHFIELRRSVEGTPREAGEVSIREGSYKIQVDSLSGNLIAKMYDKSGQVLGEGFMKLADSIVSTGVAPKLIIRPQNDAWSGRVSNAYDPRKPPQDFESRVLNDSANLDAGENSNYQMANVHRGSTTVLRTDATNFNPANTIVLSGKDFNAPLFPKSMTKALKEIVSEQLSYDLNNPDLPIIWGQVLMDGKPVAGAQVEVESSGGYSAIYFDALGLPQAELKETSTNGQFVIIGPQEGFQALIAKRGNAYFAHNVVVAERGTVSLVNLESTLKTKNVPLRVFDAFTGEPRAAGIEMQSLEEPLDISAQGWTTILLPDITRMSLMQVTPSGEYIPAQYIYQDSQDYIHVPLVREDWLTTILQPKWDIIDAAKGTVVGFFPAEGFEVYLAGPDLPPENITYFDANGARTQTGVAGGGFIISNVEPGAQEVVIFGKQSEKLYSRLLPVDSRSVSVLTFQDN